MSNSHAAAQATPGRLLPRVAGATLAVGAAAAIWGIGIERHLYALRRVEAQVLPAGAEPIRVLHLADIHMAPWQRRKQRWIASLADLEPDLIVNTGDSIGHVDSLRSLRTAFSGFRGIPGLFVHGSNDLYAPSPRNPFRYFLGPSKRIPRSEKIDPHAMERYYTATLGWTDLNNRADAITVRGTRIDAFGVGDAHHGLDRIDLVPGMAEELRHRAAESAESDAPAITLGVAHAPYRRVLDTFVDNGADVIFAGHTHGGQVNIPGVGALVANCDIPLKQAKGLSIWRRSGRRVPLNVSAGIGHSIYAPVRFACRPEATLLTLLPREA